MKADFAAAMPAMAAHEGEWEGIYRHIAADGTVIDQHHTWTWCEFPDEGPFAYVQHNRLSWKDGRTATYEFGGVFEDGQLRWNTDRFSGHGWETGEGVIMLKLDRNDVPGSYYIEMITIAPDGQSRARTWQWFKDGKPWKRTLCDEIRVR